MSEKIHSLIVGPGAVGHLLCAHIQQYSQVWVYPHKPTLNLTKHVHTTRLITLKWQILASNQQSIDLIWICSKAEHSLAVAHELLTQHKQASVVLLHNGMGPQQQLAIQFPGRVIFAMTTNAVFKQKDGLFHQTAFGVTPLGYPNSATPYKRNWVNIIADWQGNMGFQADRKIENALWKKLAMNAVINPLTAFYNIKNGALLEPDYEPTIALLCNEIEQVACAECVELPYPLTDTIYDVIKLTADNYSSMQQDVFYRRKTEVEFILGFLLTCAQKHQISTPNLQQWHQAILSRHDSFTD